MSKTTLPSQTINGIALTVSPATSDLLAAVHFGFAQAVEMFKVVTQPTLPQGQAVATPIFRGDEDEEVFAPGVLDIAGLWAMPPIQREAVLSQYGLQVAIEPEPEPEPDPVHAEIAAATGLAPLGEKEEE